LLADFLARAELAREPASHPLDWVLQTAAGAYDIGQAFACGYFAATEQLLARCGVATPRGQRVSLAVTEPGGAHPRALRSNLQLRDGALTLSGEKVWTTLADLATHLLIVVRDEREATSSSDLPRLVAFLCPAGSDGLALELLPETPFCPELRHGRLQFERLGVTAEERVAEDAFTQLLKPFRSLEDATVAAAVLSFLCRLTVQRGLSQALTARTLLLLHGVWSLAQAPDGPFVWVALAGLMDELQALLPQLVDALRAEHPACADALQRDLPLLAVTSRLRATRRAKGLAALSAQPPLTT
jgi:alkylation response protein AidB-like acyl-CoA dehydrogenase